MKFALIIPDGVADEPQESLGGRTPLAAARTPAMDEVARRGVVGRADHVPPHLPAGSAVANLSLLGYDPNEHFTGRAPLEAAAQGIQLGETDWAVRCNLVTIEERNMRDFTAGHITNDEARALLTDAQEQLGRPGMEFVTGVSYRNLLICREPPAVPFTSETRTTPPHDLINLPIVDDFPRGPGSDLLLDLMEASASLFRNHPVNQTRREAGKPPATHVWLWGLGKSPRLESFEGRFGVRGVMITAVDLLRGIARLAGWEVQEVPGATGYTDTDYAAKGRYGVDALQRADLVCVHVEATDEASHEGDQDAKIAAAEAIDRHIVAPLAEAVDQTGGRILICPDHRTPLRTRMHSHGWVPFAMAGAGVVPDSADAYHEQAAADGERELAAGHRLMAHFLQSGEVSWDA